MRITSVNAAVTGGGAEFVARSLHERYLERGHESWLIVGNKNAEEPNTLELPNLANRSGWARGMHGLASRVEGHRYVNRALRTLAEPARFSRVMRGHEDFDHPATAGLLELTPALPEVLHLHNLHGAYFDIRALPALTAQVPSVLTLHDTWVLTGHCAHPLECERWLTGCETCPYLDRYVPLHGDQAAENFALKRRVLAQSALAYATPSRWLMDMLERSGVLEGALDARVIPNGIDTRLFAPGDRAAARGALGIAPDTLVLATSGRDLLANPYKGFDLLESALATLAAAGVRATLLAIGSDAPVRTIGGIEVRPVPFVHDPRALAELYRASDVYVHPARAEVLGLTIVEALACGVPAVASRVGGIPEVVRDGENGLLVPAEDPAALASALGTLLGDEGLRQRLGTHAATDAAARFSLDAQADAYLGLYTDLVTARGSAARATGSTS